MTSTVSSFFLRDTMLKRQGRTARARRVPEPELTSTNSHPLNIILEEEELRTSSRSTSPMASSSSSGSRSPGIKAKRRHANVSEIRIAQDAAIFIDNDLSPIHDSLFTPRPAPKPPTETSSPEQSPDSFKLTFTDVSFKFPHPPGRVSSPTRSISSLSSSPYSQHGGMPLTPSTSDDESSDFLNPRRAPVRPLVITKHNPRPSSPHEISISPSLLHPFKDLSEQASEGNAVVSPYSDSFLEDSSDDSDAESDNEWYTRQFSKILTLRSPIPPSFPLQNPSRPESMFIPSDMSATPSRKRISKVLPTPSLPHRDSLESFTASSKRTSRIPNYPPPPVPPIPVHLRSESGSSFTSCSKSLPTADRRPPPRSSIPADCDFDLDAEDHADDASSEFSFSMYDIELGERVAEKHQSPVSAYSQSSCDDDDDLSAQDITFDLDYSMMLPLSLPASPFDLEADFAMSLEKFRTEETEVQQPSAALVEPKPEALEQIPMVRQPASLPEELVVDDIFSPVSSAFSFSPAPSIQYHSPPSPQHKVYNDEKVLKSKWSSSTLGSVREEHERRGTSSKLRLYFGGQSPAKSKRTSSSAGKKVPPTPTSPFGGFISPRKTSRGHTSPPAASPSRSGHHSRGVSDVMVIGYGGGGGAVGVRRRGSVATVSDAGSEESSSSTSSSGLRRKPIPIEMFLRSDLPVFGKSATSA